jgi:hypothetical protein
LYYETWEDDNYYFFFRPTASRHFALEHELPNKGSSINRDDIIVWDIPEVTVAANAPSILNDPAVIAEREIDARIANFVSDGTNAIVTGEAGVRLMELEFNRLGISGRKLITTIPRGEIITILKENNPLWVKYKDFEGYITDEHYLKR